MPGLFVMLDDLWAFGDEVLCFNISNSTDWLNDSAPETTRQDVIVQGVEVDGYRTERFGPFGVANGGLLGVTPAEGDVTFRDCTFRDCRVGPGVVGYRDADIRVEDIQTDHCRGNCIQVIDIIESRVRVQDCPLICDSFPLPRSLSVARTVCPAVRGASSRYREWGAAIGYPSNVQWASLAYSIKAHTAHREAGPLWTWRPQGPSAAQGPTKLTARDNSCVSSTTPNTYCLHLADLENLAFGVPTLSALVQRNSCRDSQTCISLEHIQDGRVVDNRCARRSTTGAIRPTSPIGCAS